MIREKKGKVAAPVLIDFDVAANEGDINNVKE
jgi:hypothetical protein